MTTIDLRAGRSDGLEIDSAGCLALPATGTNERRGVYISQPLQIDRHPDASPLVTWTERWTAPQRFRKHPANPIFGPDQTGDWDQWTNGVSVVRTPDGARYRMYYCGRKGAGIGFAEASIADPLAWREHPASPVLTPRADNWEGDMLNQPRVVKVTDEHWRMYYTGWGYRPSPERGESEGGTSWAMGLAESFDGGTTWRRARDEPILPRGQSGDPDDGGACVPTLLRVGNQWWMWYTAGKVNPAGHQNIHLCLATSDDGLEWTKHPANPVLTDDFGDAPRSVTSRCCVRRERGVFRLWYSFAKPDYRICYAESLDGVHWERSPIQPALDASPAPTWDDQMVEYPEIDVVDGQWRLWFCGNGFGSVGFAEGIVEAGVEIEARTRDTPATGADDVGWSPWRAIEHGERAPAGRFMQLRATVWSHNPRIQPAVGGIEIG